MITPIKGETTMFWNSVIAGLKTLTFWETYVASLEYLAILYIPVIVVIMITKNDEESESSGCLLMPLMLVFQIVATAVMVLTIAPIILGFYEEADWSLPWKLLFMEPGAFFKFLGLLVVATIILLLTSVIPILGPILSKVKSLDSLVLGGLTLAFYLHLFQSVNPYSIRGPIALLPGIWFSIGLIVIGEILSWGSIIVVALALSPLERVRKGLGQTIALPIGYAFGFIPVFIYGAWLGAQVRGGF